jgi:hypothetical protein
MVSSSPESTSSRSPPPWASTASSASREFPVRDGFYDRQNLLVAVLFKSLAHSSEADVLNVLEPFKIGHGHTTGVEVVVGDDQGSHGF